MASQGGNCLAWRVKEVLASYGKSASFLPPLASQLRNPPLGCLTDPAAATAQLLVRRPLLPGQPAFRGSLGGGGGREGSGPQLKRGHCQGPHPSGVPRGPLGTWGPALGAQRVRKGWKEWPESQKGDARRRGCAPGAKEKVCSSWKEIVCLEEKIVEKKVVEKKSLEKKTLYRKTLKRKFLKRKIWERNIIKDGRNPQRKRQPYTLQHVHVQRKGYKEA